MFAGNPPLTMYDVRQKDVVKLWNETRGGEKIKAVREASWSPCGKKIAAISADESIHILDVSTGKFDVVGCSVDGSKWFQVNVS